MSEFEEYFQLPPEIIRSDPANFMVIRVIPKPNRPANLIMCLTALKSQCLPVLRDLLEELGHSVKIFVTIEVEYESVKPDPYNTPFKKFKAYLRTPSEHLTQALTPETYLNRVGQIILERNANYIREKSGLVLSQIFCVEINASHFNPLRGSCFKELPSFIEKKKAVLNIRNTDTRCFGYCIVASILNIPGPQHPNRASKYTEEHFRQYGLDRLQYPVALTDLPDIEGTLNISINVFSFYDDEGKARYPVYISRRRAPHEVDLLYWEEHFALIRDFERLMFDLNKYVVFFLLLNHTMF
jgi:hypothetical protein